MKPIKQSVINTFNRVGFPYEKYGREPKTTKVSNRFSGESVETSVLVATLISTIYDISNAYERGDYSVKVADFDRLRYFVLSEDSKAYMRCLD